MIVLPLSKFRPRLNFVVQHWLGQKEALIIIVAFGMSESGDASLILRLVRR
jgi:hypothetical protein